MTEELTDTIYRLLEQFTVDANGTHCVVYTDDGIIHACVNEGLADTLDALRDYIGED